ncbi:uncharacterized protein LOC132058606 [Lycium ferocissimum]|uniref:uncharacterized protein LOC132058606 n=1 Tax=Lycium ferocissimum TaxID=112874 RepID=UPI00281605DA|nr:uncharacterized protein LOC132058606 [Lycium ferocissimum]
MESNSPELQITSSSNSNSNSNIVDHNHPLYLAVSDTSGAVQIDIQLLGMENYTLWSRAMRLTLLTKNKIGFIDGSVKRDTYGAEYVKHWDRCNAMVISWIMRNVNKNLLSGILYRNSAHSVWKDLKERFDKINLSRVYQLKKELAMLHQGVSPVSSYYSRMKDLWDEIDSIIPHHSCDCDKPRSTLSICRIKGCWSF